MQPRMMKAVVQDAYGPPELLRLQDVAIPTIEDDEVLVQLRAMSVHPDVWHVVTGLPYTLRLFGSGLTKPKRRTPGTDLAGVIVQVGQNVSRFTLGDAVFGEAHRGMQWRNGGAYAEYVAVPEDVLVHKPANVSFEQAAAVGTAGVIAAGNLRPDALRRGQRALVNGAGGGVGSIALQMLEASGAHVTAVDHTDKLDLLRQLGADRVIDYTREDFTRSDERYDLLFDVPGNHTYAECCRVLTADGSYVLIAHDRFQPSVLGQIPRMFGLMARATYSRHLRFDTSMPTQLESLTRLAQLLEAGALTPVIDRRYTLAEVPQALRYLETGSARGRIVITV